MAMRERSVPWSIIGRVILVVVALPLAVAVFTVLGILAVGIGDPGKQLFLPRPLFFIQETLTLILPFATALSLGWWSRLSAAAWGALSWRGILGIAWIILIALDILDLSWRDVLMAWRGLAG